MDLKLMQALTTKMDWQEERQKILSQNIANADTPNYRPQDLKSPDFKSLLGSSTSKLSLDAPSSVDMATTNSAHLSSGGTSGNGDNMQAKNQKNTYEVAPAGNAVVLEEQLMKLNENFTDHRMITGLYQKNIEILKMSLK